MTLPGALASGSVQALVATDVAARGIHVDDVACVVHFDPAGDEKAYVHRSGRTGRAGAAGLVVSLVDGPGEAEARKLQKSLGLPTGLESPGSVTGGGRPQTTAPAAPPRRPAPHRRSRGRGRGAQSRSATRR